jgi:hypothetical protein
MLWEVKTLVKKNVFQRTHFVVPDDSEIAAGKTFYMEEWYRWGRCVIRTDTPPAIEEDPYTDPLDLDYYDVEDQECDDGCALVFTFEDRDGWTEEEKQFIEDLWSEDGWLAFEEHGIMSDDCDVHYYGPLEIVCIDDTPEPVSTGTWPF